VTAVSDLEELGQAPLPQQSEVIEHPANRHGRVLAGPGTGKSTTVLRLGQRLLQEVPPIRVRIVTFTRAATAELADKIRQEGHDVAEPSTLHAFALSILMRNPNLIELPFPLRLPADWEVQNLVHPDIARRLRNQGHHVTVRIVDKLERELAAQWEKLDPGLILLADLDPALRNAYIATWTAHRKIFGYSVFAEIPYSAHHLVDDHPDLQLPDLALLIVDEFQDLNAAEIALVKALAELGTSILAVGDDDQSIYGFRMADPAGIRDIHNTLPNLIDYPLTVSLRCGTAILSAARTFIESTPGRPARPALEPGPNNAAGEFHYLRFGSAGAECAGVVRLIAYLINHDVAPKDIVVLTRGDYNSAWSAPLRQALVAGQIPATDVEAALQPLSQTETRRVLSIARLVVNPRDGLAWWTLLHLTPGIAQQYIDRVADEALALGETFSTRLMRILEQSPAGVSAQSQARAVQLVQSTTNVIEEVTIAGVAEALAGWAPWLLELGDQLGIDISDEFRQLATDVGMLVPQSEGLGYFLNQLEPVTKDLALRTDGVAIMTMSRSKGLTFRAAILMGVEEGIVPSPRADDESEERRLLYVAMTRAREYCYLTMATNRTGPTARSGAPNVGASRGRCPFFHALGPAFAPKPGLAYLTSIQA
jgi:DNA helicase-2/ATP-dependent DNA helicase PcrA